MTEELQKKIDTTMATAQLVGKCRDFLLKHKFCGYEEMRIGIACMDFLKGFKERLEEEAKAMTTVEAPQSV